MERRTFIKGLLAGVAGAEAIVRLATPAEGRALALGEPAFVAQLPPPIAFGPPDLMIPEVFMRNAKGEFYQVGFLTSFRITQSVMDFSNYDGTMEFISGLKRAHGTFNGQLV